MDFFKFVQFHTYLPIWEKLTDFAESNVIYQFLSWTYTQQWQKKVDRDSLWFSTKHVIVLVLTVIRWRV